MSGPLGRVTSLARTGAKRLVAYGPAAFASDAMGALGEGDKRVPTES